VHLLEAAQTRHDQQRVALAAARDQLKAEEFDVGKREHELQQQDGQSRGLKDIRPSHRYTEVRLPLPL
jgi:hypothetical protein